MLNVAMPQIKINIANETRLNGDARTKNTINIIVLPEDTPAGVRAVMCHELGHLVSKTIFMSLAPRAKQFFHYKDNPPELPPPGASKENISRYKAITWFIANYSWAYATHGELCADVFMVAVTGDPGACSSRDFRVMDQDTANATFSIYPHRILNPVRAWLWQNRIKALVNPLQPEALAKLTHNLITVSASQIEIGYDAYVATSEKYKENGNKLVRNMNKQLINILSKN
ncbi:MAG: hypothetical protein WCS77_08730 [Elusimicrobiaceae bacterium]